MPHKSAAEQQLDELSHEHDRLLREIRKQQARLSEVRALRSELQTRVAVELEPVQRRIAQMLVVISGLFEQVLAHDSGLSRRNKSTVRRSQAAFRQDFCLGESAQRIASEPQPPPPSPEVAKAAHKPDVDRAATLHTIFRRLVNAVHPDKVQSNAEKEERTELLKQVTRAYETQDLALLVHFESTLLAPVPTGRDVEDVKRRVSEVSASNAELRRQLKAVTRELRSVKRSLPEHVWISTAELSADPLDVELAAGRLQLERLEVTERLLTQLLQDNTSALPLLDGSWRLQTPASIQMRGSHTSRFEPPIVEVNDTNVEAVLAAFKRQLEKRRR